MATDRRACRRHPLLLAGRPDRKRDRGYRRADERGGGRDLKVSARHFRLEADTDRFTVEQFVWLPRPGLCETAALPVLSRALSGDHRQFSRLLTMSLKSTMLTSAAIVRDPVI